jgi:hypothetical protein
MLMPSFQNKVAIFRDRLEDIRKFTRFEAVTIGYRYLRLKPDLRILAAAGNMNVSRFRRLSFV